MTEHTSRAGRRGIVGSLPLVVVAIWACGGSSTPLDPGDGGPGQFGTGDDSSTGSTSSSSGLSSSGGSSGSSSGSGGSGAGVSSTCIVGTRGCLCDTAGGCGTGLTCSPQSTGPSLCCSGSNCAASGGPIGSTCGVATAAAMCTPGITILPASGSNDGCGYPASGFNESTILCGITATGGGAKPAVIEVYYSDEHALPLGCATPTYPVSALPADPSQATYPQTGDPACVDSMNRPLRPVLYVTDLTADPTCTKGDLQNGGHPYDPIAVFGTWKSATEGAGNMGTPAQADPMGNGWNLGSSADAVPAAVMACNQGGGGGGGRGGGGGGGGSFGAELRFEVGLISGHSYRFQAVIHDGDQTRGGDSGEGCAVFCAGSGMACPQGAPLCTAGNACPTGMVCAETNGCCYPPGQIPADAGPGVIR
jgi:hypothetical protein